MKLPLYLLLFLFSRSMFAGTCNGEVVRADNTQRIVVSDERRKAPKLLGFNMNLVLFEEQFWAASEDRINPFVTHHLRNFNGNYYRYPGGELSNYFNWHEAVGPHKNRQQQKLVHWKKEKKVLFGIGEYLKFLDTTGGAPLFVVNLSGWNKVKLKTELPLSVIVDSNRKFAELVKSKLQNKGIPRVYELGNELDRHWSVDRYIERARAVYQAMSKIDPDATFILSLREFDWIYRGKNSHLGTSKGMDFINSVFRALPELSNFSLHYYYDPEKKKLPVWFHKVRLRMMRKAIETAEAARGGRKVGLWITEHARKWERYPYEHTSNMESSISTADFLVALSQMEHVRAAMWHELNGNPWRLFEPLKNNDSIVKPRPIYWVFRALEKSAFSSVLCTKSYSQNNSDYEGGYDLRATSFIKDDESRIGLWVINRSKSVEDVTINIASLAGKSVNLIRYIMTSKTVDYGDTVLAGKQGKKVFDVNGNIRISLQPESVSSMIIIKDE